VRLAAGVPVVDLLVETGLAASKSAARRLIQQGGASLNGTRLAHLEAVVTSADLHDGALLLRAGKKTLPSRRGAVRALQPWEKRLI
jgi:tyrosyl-tRNA synthetase